MIFFGFITCDQRKRRREAYKRGRYKNDEHAFWREIERLQSQLDALEQFTPREVHQAEIALVNLQQVLPNSLMGVILIWGDVR